MGLRERLVAQIVRDFMDAYVLASRIRTRLESGVLDFDWIRRLVGDAEESALYRLKEECHALFRRDGLSSNLDLHAGELFDLAVAALFHEAMKFRESYYLTATYEPRLARMRVEGTASGPLVAAFHRIFERGRRRVREAESGVAELFRETRDQLLIVLQQMESTGAVARSLVENPARTEEVFGMPLSQLLARLYGSAREGYRLAVESLVHNGHFAEAASLLSGAPLAPGAIGREARSFARGMACYYAGDVREAVSLLSSWVFAGADGLAGWRSLARQVLNAVAANDGAADPLLGRNTGALLEKLTEPDRA